MIKGKKTYARHFVGSAVLGTAGTLGAGFAMREKAPEPVAPVVQNQEEKASDAPPVIKEIVISRGEYENLLDSVISDIDTLPGKILAGIACSMDVRNAFKKPSASLDIYPGEDDGVTLKVKVQNYDIPQAQLANFENLIALVDRARLEDKESPLSGLTIAKDLIARQKKNGEKRWSHDFTGNVMTLGIKIDSLNFSSEVTRKPHTSTSFPMNILGMDYRGSITKHLCGAEQMVSVSR